MNPTRSTLVLIGCLLILLSLIMAVAVLLHGKTTVSGKYPTNNVSQLVSCSGTNYEYPYFNTSKAHGTSTAVDVLFVDDSISRISLSHKILFESSEQATHFMASAPIELSNYYAKDGLPYNAFDATFYNDMDGIVFSIIDDESSLLNRKYFLLNDLPTEMTPEDIEEYLEMRSFDCMIFGQ